MIIDNKYNRDIAARSLHTQKSCASASSGRMTPTRNLTIEGTSQFVKGSPLPKAAAYNQVRPSLEAEIASAVKEGILEGQWNPGDRLVEMDLAQHFGVSQGTIRGALKYLQADGLVEHHPRRGNFVIALSQEDIRDISLMRDTLEALAARLAAEKIDDDGRTRLTKIVDEMRQASRRHQRRRLLELDLRFHRAVIEIAGSRLLLDMYKRLEGPALLFLRMADGLYQQPETIVVLHEPLLEAICSGDSGRAYELAQRHTDEDAGKLTARKGE